MSTLIKDFSEISLKDVPIVGGKNASSGEMFNHLSSKGIRVPVGFATTASAFWEFIDNNNLREPLLRSMGRLNKENFSNLKEIGREARELILLAKMPIDISNAVTDAYRKLCEGNLSEVAVRSSATAEDLPEASFAGQHESFLNVRGEKALINSVQKCFASLYTDRAIKYREDNHFSHEKIALSVGVQRMVRSDKACSGVGFTLEPESGFRDIIHLAGVWGLGENIVQGTVTPDEFLIFKPSIRQGKKAIIQKKLGEKAKTMVYGDDEKEPVCNIDTSIEKRNQFVLSDAEITQLANWSLLIESHYEKPMDIEWAKDGINGELFIIQARPETVHSRRNPMQVKQYELLEKVAPLVSGEAIGSAVATGVARILTSPKDSDKLQPGEIVISDLTSPDWDPVLKKSAAIITNKGGRTSHASIIARELGVPAIVGTVDGTSKIRDGQQITVSCCEGKTGFVYDRKLKYKETALDFTGSKMPDNTEVMLIVGDPEKAFTLSFYPNDGVGLMRIEFIINHSIGIHPMALARFNDLKDDVVKRKIEAKTHQYPDKVEFFIDKLTEGVATIAAAFYPKDVIVRMSDFKTNEYANLTGGAEFEPIEGTRCWVSGELPAITMIFTRTDSSWNVRP